MASIIPSRRRAPSAISIRGRCIACYRTRSPPSRTAGQHGRRARLLHAAVMAPLMMSGDPVVGMVIGWRRGARAALRARWIAGRHRRQACSPCWWPHAGDTGLLGAALGFFVLLLGRPPCSRAGSTGPDLGLQGARLRHPTGVRAQARRVVRPGALDRVPALVSLIVSSVVSAVGDYVGRAPGRRR